MNATIILLKLCLALVSSYFFGYGVTRLTRMPKTLAVPAGYALTQILYFAVYMALFNSTASFVFAVALPTVITLYTIRHKKHFSHAEGYHSAGSPVLVIGSVVIILISAWPYLVTSPGNYWHSGNEDFFDGINGRDAFLQKESAVQEYGLAIFRENNTLLSKSKGMGVPQYSEPTNFDRVVAAKELVDIYAEDPGRLQYSSLAFWSVLLRADLDLDAWMIQALFNLLLMAHGLMLLMNLIL